VRLFRRFRPANRTHGWLAEKNSFFPFAAQQHFLTFINKMDANYPNIRLDIGE
jgi:hypothetical protein